MFGKKKFKNYFILPLDLEEMRDYEDSLDAEHDSITDWSTNICESKSSEQNVANSVDSAKERLSNHRNKFVSYMEKFFLLAPNKTISLKLLVELCRISKFNYSKYELIAIYNWASNYKVLKSQYMAIKKIK